MGAFAALIAQGLPWDVALDQLQRGGRIAEDVDTEELALRIATERAADRLMAEQIAAATGQARGDEDKEEDDAA